MNKTLKNIQKMRRKKNMKNDLKIQFISQKPPILERDKALYYYDLRNSEIDNGYTIEKCVVANCIGSLVANQDILKGKEYITDEELEKLNYIEVNDLIQDEEELEI